MTVRDDILKKYGIGVSLPSSAPTLTTSTAIPDFSAVRMNTPTSGVLTKQLTNQVPDFSKMDIAPAPREMSGLAKTVAEKGRLPITRQVIPTLIEIAQGASRDFGALLRGGETITPETSAQRMVFGDKPFNIETVGREYLDIIGKGKEASQRTAFTVGVFAGILSIPLSLGKAVIRGSATILSKLDDTGLILNEFKRIGLKGDDKELEALAQVFKAERDPRVIETALTSFQKEAKAAEEAAKATARGEREVSAEAPGTFADAVARSQTPEGLQDSIETLTKQIEETKLNIQKGFIRGENELDRATEFIRAKEASIAERQARLAQVSKVIPEEASKTIGTLSTRKFGKVNLVSGVAATGKSSGFGQAKIVEKLSLSNEETTRLLDTLPVKSETGNRIILENDDYRAIISKDWFGKPNEPWLMNLFSKKPVRRAGLEPAPSPVSGERSAIELSAQAKPSKSGADVKHGVETPKLPKAPTPTKLLGEAPPARITRTAQEKTLLKEKIKQQATGAKAGAKEGEFLGKQTGFREGMEVAGKTISKQATQIERAAVLAEKKDSIITILRNTAESGELVKGLVVQYAKDALSTANRGKALTLIRDAKDAKGLTKAFARINRWAEEEIKVGIKADVLKLQKKIMDSPSVAIDYKARVKELMGDFELKGHRESTLERLKKTQEFLQSEATKGNDIELPRRVLRALEILNRTPFEEITINQLKGLQAEMELLEDLGRTKFRTIESIWETQKAKILGEVETQGAKPIQNIELIKPEIGERLTLTQKFKNLIWRAGNQAARIDKAISPMDTIFDLLDGGKGAYSGANFRFFKGQVDAGYGRYNSRKWALADPIKDLAEKYKLDNTNFERMGIVAAREQEGGMEKLIATGFTEAQVGAVKLSTQEQELLNLMRSTMDSQFPEIQDVMRRVYNQPVGKVKNYFSFMTDWKAMDESEVFQRFGSQLPEQYGAPRKNVEAGFTKSRVGGDQKIKINAMEIFDHHIDNTSYLLELGETTKMLGEVAASPKYAELVGDVGQLMVREWLDVMARKGGAAGASQIAVFDTLRRNVGAGILGLKLSTIAIQPTALIDGAGFIGAGYATRGATHIATSNEWRKFVFNMPEIKDRVGGEFALRELTDNNWLQKAQRKGFIPMQTVDQYTAGAIAAGAYERKMIELGQVIDLTKPYNEEALAYAQLAVRRTQSSGAFKDVPLAVSRGALTGNRSLDRAMLQFQNFLLTRWSRIRHDAIRAGINTGDPKKAIPVFTAITMAAIAGSGIRLGVNKVQDFITGKEDEDTVAQDLTKGFMYEMTGNVPFLGTAVSMAMYDGEMFPILDAPKGMISGLNRVITSESEGAKLRGLTELVGSTGALLGIPGSLQAETLVRGALQEKPKASPITRDQILKKYGVGGGNVRQQILNKYGI